jgi:hypothetical protein
MRSLLVGVGDRAIIVATSNAVHQRRLRSSPAACEIASDVDPVLSFASQVSMLTTVFSFSYCSGKLSSANLRACSSLRSFVLDDAYTNKGIFEMPLNCSTK